MEVVVCFRAASGASFLADARALLERARASGGRLVAFHANEIAFAFDDLSLALPVAIHAAPPFAVGLAEGELERFHGGAQAASHEPDAHAMLAVGGALAIARALSTAADPGEILCAESVGALRSGELLRDGVRLARDGDRRVRGVLLDTERPWRSQAAVQLMRMRVAPLTGVEPLEEPVASGELMVVRSDPGTGGSRWLTELASSAARGLVLSPSGSGFEPLGALRRAFGRSITRELNPKLVELAVSLEALLAGEGLSVAVAARLVSAYFWPRSPGESGLLVIDDVGEVDEASIEACALAARSVAAPIGLVARLETNGALPALLATLPGHIEITLGSLAQDAAEALAAGCTNDALDPAARRRWARLGGRVPLGIIEAVAWGIQSGDIAWRGPVASPRTRRAGRGRTMAASEWIALRAREQSVPARTVLGLVALLGGEAKIPRLARILEHRGDPMDVDAVVQALVAERWLFDTQEDWVALPSRTHIAALSMLFDDAARIPLHASAAAVIEEEEGIFGRVEAAWHAAKSNDVGHASMLLLEAARAAADAELESSTAQLAALARRIDPSCEDEALEIMGEAIETKTSLRPPPVMGGPGEEPAFVPSPPPGRVESAPPAELFSSLPPPAPAPASVAPPPMAHDSEPPTIAKVELPPLVPPPRRPPVASEPPPVRSDVPPSEGADIAKRLGELARDALLAADSEGLERWVDGLRAAGDNPIYAERMTAMARLGRGDVGDALRVLRRTRSKLEPEDHKRRCQTSLALGVALNLAGRRDEALLEGLEALGRARQIADQRGAQACLAFLSKLYLAAGRDEESARLRAARPLPAP